MTLEGMHKQYIYSQLCPVVGCRKQPVPHHLRGRGLGGGVGLKPDFLYSIPLCSEHHQEIHQIGIDTFEERHSVDLLRVLVCTLQGFVVWIHNDLVQALSMEGEGENIGWG